MFSSWEFWLLILLLAVGIGISLTWIERRSEKKIIVGQPAQYPTQLITALKTYFENCPEVEAAYLAQISGGAETTPPHPVIGVEVSGEFTNIQKEMGEIVFEACEDGEIVDVMPLGADAVSEYMKRQTQPFYKK